MRQRPRCLLGVTTLLLLLALVSVGCTAQILNSFPDRDEDAVRRSSAEYSADRVVVAKDGDPDAASPFNRETHTGVDADHFATLRQQHHNTSASVLTSALTAISVTYIAIRSHKVATAIAVRCALIFAALIAGGRLIGVLVKCVRRDSSSSATAASSASSSAASVSAIGNGGKSSELNRMMTRSQTAKMVSGYNFS